MTNGCVRSDTMGRPLGIAHGTHPGAWWGDAASVAGKDAPSRGPRKTVERRDYQRIRGALLLDYC